jgi:histidinol-phosphatase (PHP family)
VRAPSLHTHSNIDDGVGTIEDYVRAAIERGLPAFGASGHAPVPWANTYAMPLASLPTYMAEVQRVREVYRGQIEVYLGLELDHHTQTPGYYATPVFSQPFDYFIGSVHYIGDLDGEPWGYESTREIFDAGLYGPFEGDIQRVIEDYYALERDLARWAPINIIGHLDRIKIHNVGNRLFDETAAWYIDAVEATLTVIAASGKIVELNTSGWRRDLQAPYPSAWIARRCAQLRIPMCISADAHHPDHIDSYFDAAADLLRAAGHRHIAVLRGGQWGHQPL